jgi:hypothetical protein
VADKKAFLLRLDPALWTALERLAQSDLRSVNGQIEFLLRDALSRRGVTPAQWSKTTGSSPGRAASGGRGRRGAMD